MVEVVVVTVTVFRASVYLVEAFVSRFRTLLTKK